MANTPLKGQTFGQKLPPLYKEIEDILKEYPSGQIFKVTFTKQYFNYNIHLHLVQKTPVACTLVTLQLIKVTKVIC